MSNPDKKQESLVLFLVTRKSDYNTTGKVKPRVVGVFGEPTFAELGVGVFSDEKTEAMPRDFLTILNEKMVGRRVGKMELAKFYLAFSKTYGRSGDVQKALALASLGIRNPRMRGVVGSMRYLLREGKELHDAMSRHVAVFGSVSVWMVRAAMQTGQVAEVFGMLSEQLKKEGKLMTKIIKKFAYPVLMVYFALTIFFAVEFFVIPAMMKSFAAMGGELPMITLFFAKISDILMSCPPIAGIPYVVPFIIYGYWWKIHKKEWVQRKMVSAPIFGPIFVSIIVSRSLRVAAMLMQSGVPLERACVIVGQVSGNIVFCEYFEAVRGHLGAGKDAEVAFLIERDRIGQMGEVIATQVAVGSQSGSTDSLFIEVANEVEDETETKVELAIQFTEPLIIGVVGMMSLVILIAIYYPGFAMLIHHLRQKY